MTTKPQDAPCPQCGNKCVEVSILGEGYTRWWCRCGAAGGLKPAGTAELADDTVGWVSELVDPEPPLNVVRAAPYFREPGIEVLADVTLPSTVLVPWVPCIGWGSAPLPGKPLFTVEAYEAAVAEWTPEPEPPNNTPPGLLRVAPFPTSARMGGWSL